MTYKENWIKMLAIFISVQFLSGINNNNNIHLHYMEAISTSCDGFAT